MIFIAELGINAHGNIDKMKRMCDFAHQAGATYIKGQYYNPWKVLGRNHPDLQYAIQCQFSREQHEQIYKHCKSIGANYFVSVFTPYDVAWANSFSVVHKIASRMNTNAEFIAKVEQTKKPVFMSVQPETSVRIPDRFKLMWCIREYPSLKEDILKYPYNNIGLSSHCPDWKASYEAVKLGARVLENHLCESKDELGCDIASSLTFEEYQRLIHECVNHVAKREREISSRV